MEHITYRTEIEVVILHGREIVLENLVPVYTPAQQASKQREMEEGLYEVLHKYAVQNVQKAG